MPGWEEEAEQEDRDLHVESRVKLQGRHEYYRIYEDARALKMSGKTDEAIIKELDTGPRNIPIPNRDVSDKSRRAAERHADIRQRVENELSRIRKEAIDDAITGRP